MWDEETETEYFSNWAEEEGYNLNDPDHYLQARKEYDAYIDSMDAWIEDAYERAQDRRLDDAYEREWAG